MAGQSTEIQITGGTQISYVSAVEAVGTSMMEKASENVRVKIAEIRDEALATGVEPQDFSILQIQSMETVEALRLVNGLDLYAILLRHRFLVKIRENNLLAVHPGRYSNLKQMADGQGISVSELHDILKLGDDIFPFLTREYGENKIADLWDQIGKSAMREIVATLSSAITGERSQSANVRTAINTATEAAALQHATESTLNWEEVEPAERNRRIAREIIGIAERAPSVREMRHALRGNSGTENILFITREVNGHTVVMADLSADQRSMLNRLLSDRIDFQPIEENDGGWGGTENVFLNINAMLERARVRLSTPEEDA